MKAQWTHLALQVHSLEASIAFYSQHTNLQVVERTLGRVKHGDGRCVVERSMP
jgi:catechol 2,3-dioxygenase-like lactoylglutathione lyase family enzyme